MKWFHKAKPAQSAAPAPDAAKPDADPAKSKAARQHNTNSKAGARAKRAPAKKHISLKNRLRMLSGKPPVESAPHKRTRLFTQMLMSFIILTAITSSISGTLNMTLVRNYVQDSSLSTLLERAADIAEMVVRPGGSLKVINVQQLDEWERLTNAQVILINPDMTLITRQTLRNRKLTVSVAMPETDAASGTDASATQAPALFTTAPDPEAQATPEAAAGEPDNTELLSTIDYELVSGVLAGSNIADVRQFDFMDGTWLFAGVPIMYGDTVTGAVLLCQPLSQINYVSRNISLIMSLSVAISSLVAVMLSLLLTQRIVQPISAMNRTARRMADGNYGERVALASTAEIGQLGETLNMLSGNLATTIRSLNQEKVKMELVLSGIGEGIMAINQIGKMVHCNDAAVKLLELHEEDAQSDVYALTERSPLIGMLIQVLQNGETLNGGWKNSAGQSVAATVYPIRTGDDLIGAVGLVRDVSEAERLEQLRRDYVANISHELRTPLTGIRGMVEPLIDGVYDTEQEKQECYQIIYQETRRLERLITDMLDISRLQDGRIHIDTEQMQVNGILHAAVRRLEKRAADEGVTLSVNVPEDIDPTVLGNEDRIMQVLIILIDNALKFTPAGGSVSVHTRTGDGMLWISVRDTGAGIAREDLPYIFERFYKADKSRMETKGTGLGLAIARLVVELMGGTIWCESELGRGSSFEFSLKLFSGDDTPSEPVEAAPLPVSAPPAVHDAPAAHVAPDVPAPQPAGAEPCAMPLNPDSLTGDFDVAPGSVKAAADASVAAHREKPPHPPAASALKPQAVAAKPVEPAAIHAPVEPAVEASAGSQPAVQPSTPSAAAAVKSSDAAAACAISQAAQTGVEAQPGAHTDDSKTGDAGRVSEASRTQAQIREAAASAGVDENMDFDKLLEALLKPRKPAGAHSAIDVMDSHADDENGTEADFSRHSSNQ